MNLTKELAYAEALKTISGLSLPDAPWNTGCGVSREEHLNRRMQKRLDAYRRAKRFADVAFDLEILTTDEDMFLHGALRTAHNFWIKTLPEIEQEKARLLGGL